MRNRDGSSTTFRPAGGGKYKCNVCGELFSQHGAKRHRNFHVEKPTLPKKKVVKIPEAKKIYEPMQKAYIRGRTFLGVGHNFAHCPHCDYAHVGKLNHGFTITCERCSQRFMLVE